MVQLGILLQHRLMEVPQGAPGLDAELVDKCSPCRLVRIERLGLATGAVEREHQVADERLAVRVVAHQAVELRHELRVAASSEISVDSFLQAREVEFLQPRDRRLCGVLIGELGERRPAPERQCLVQPTAVPEIAEALEVELVRFDAENVTGRDGAQALLPEQLAQL